MWVEYPNNPKLYGLECYLIFPTTDAAEAPRQKVQKGNTPPPPNEGP